MIESVQGQKFGRYVPEDITTLLSMTAAQTAWFPEVGCVL